MGMLEYLSGMPLASFVYIFMHFNFQAWFEFRNNYHKKFTIKALVYVSNYAHMTVYVFSYV